ncbi:MAG TPA: M28 family peptidase [Anaerolineaceae bacterium]
MKEPSSQHPQVAEWLAHVRTLSVEIGPRGSTRLGERQGAEYARSAFEKMGLQPVWETFQSARSIFHPHLLGSILFLVAFILFPLGGRLTALLAAGLSVLALVSELQELAFQTNLFRLLVPKGESQNVWARIPPSGEHRRDLLLVGHVDTQRTPLIFRSKRWVDAYDRFTMIAFAAFIAQSLLFTLAVIFGWGWVWFACIPAAICAVLLAAICIEAETTPFTNGANDNATAVGMVLSLAGQLSKQPLEHTRVWAVITGCEEVQHYGMIDFYQRHRQEMKNPQALVFEMLGCAGPAWSVKEGIIVPFYSDPILVALAEKVSAAHPDLMAYPTQISGGNSELADGGRFKVPGITLFGLTKTGAAPFWHQRADTFDKLDPGVMERTWRFTQALLREIDQAG